MRVLKLFWIVALSMPAWTGSGLTDIARAQGVNDPSGLGPTMTFPIRPRGEPGGTTATPNTSHLVPQRTIRLHPTYGYAVNGGRRVYRSRR
jgi:hypothetical protein